MNPALRHLNRSLSPNSSTSINSSQQYKPPAMHHLNAPHPEAGFQTERCRRAHPQRALPRPRTQRNIGTLAALLLVGWAGVAATEYRFPDFGYLPPTNQYAGPFFRLSQDYPANKPDEGNVPHFFRTDFKKDWRLYLLQVRSYCFEGNTGGDFRVEHNPLRKWYHMPWQHWGPTGREGIHGLTKEAPVKSQQLAVTQMATGQTYAVGFYNEFAGFTIGQVWKDPMKPDLSVTTLPNEGFPEGSVLFKLLFVDVPTSQVPFLTNAVTWQAYITDSFGSANRSLRNVSLIQMDIMVKDRRAPSGWIFGNFQYNGALGPAQFENLVPVGLMWGEDADITTDYYTPLPVKTYINPLLKETIINPDEKELPPTHLGWNGRLNGPVDNPQSSCMSCHMTAEFPQVSPMSPLFLPPNQVPAGGRRNGCAGSRTSLAASLSIKASSFRTGAWCSLPTGVSSSPSRFSSSISGWMTRAESMRTGLTRPTATLRGSSTTEHRCTFTRSCAAPSNERST